MTRRVAPPKPYLVLGVGNAWRHDDGVGPYVAERVLSACPDDVEVLELDGEPTRVVDAWAGRSWAIVVDACRSGQPPGTVHRVDPRCGAIVLHPAASSTHAAGVDAAWALGSSMDLLPDEVTVLAIEGDDFSEGIGLSPAVRAAADRCVLDLLDELAEVCDVAP